MSTPDPLPRDYQFYSAGLETAAVKAIEAVAGSYASDIKIYDGELDDADLATAIERLAPRCPLFLAGLVRGKSTRLHRLGDHPNAPWVKRHDFDFVVIVMDDNSRGSDERRLTVYRMVSDVERALDNKQLYHPEEPGALLNAGAFDSQGVENVATLADMTARAVPLTGYFIYTAAEPDEPGRPVSGVGIGVEHAESRVAIPNLPGIEVRS